MSRNLRRLTAAALIPLAFVAASCSDSSQVDNTERDEDGEVVDGGAVGVFKLQEGDCVKLPSALGPSDDDQGGDVEVDAMEAIPCTELHDGEVILVDDQFFADLTEFPGVEAGTEQATPACVEALDAYTGTDFDTSSFNVVPLVPTEPSWEALDDRGVVCIGVTLDAELVDTIETTGSIRVGG
jgi:hypothetical protein